MFKKMFKFSERLSAFRKSLSWEHLNESVRRDDIIKEAFTQVLCLCLNRCKPDLISFTITDQFCVGIPIKMGILRLFAVPMWRNSMSLPDLIINDKTALKTLYYTPDKCMHCSFTPLPGGL